LGPLGTVDLWMQERSTWNLVTNIMSTIALTVAIIVQKGHGRKKKKKRREFVYVIINMLWDDRGNTNNKNL